jgi:hypothetical protein
MTFFEECYIWRSKDYPPEHEDHNERDAGETCSAANSSLLITKREWFIMTRAQHPAETPNHQKARRNDRVLRIATERR